MVKSLCCLLFFSYCTVNLYTSQTLSNKDYLVAYKCSWNNVLNETVVRFGSYF